MASLEQIQQLVDQLSPDDQARLVAYLAPRVVSAAQPFHSSKPSDAWTHFFQLGDHIATLDSPNVETLTTAVSAMRR